MTSAVVQLIVSILMLAISSGLPAVDNAVQVVPEIECGATEIIVGFMTRYAFEGNVYAKVCVGVTDG